MKDLERDIRYMESTWRFPSYGETVLAKFVPIALVLGIMAAAAAIIALAPLTWVDFDPGTTSGFDADAATGLGDGYFVAGLAAAVMLFVGGMIFRPALALWLLPGIGIAAVATLTIAGYDLATSWHAAGFDAAGNAFVHAGTPTVAPLAVALLAAGIAISAAVLAGFQYYDRRRRLAA